MPRFTRENASAMGQRGGRATAEKHGREHMRKIGRKGFHATVRKHYGGDYQLAVNTLIARGLMALDPVPQNGAWTKDRITDRLPADFNDHMAAAHTAAE